MGQKAHYQILFAYHWHTTNRLLELAGRLDPAVFASAPSHGRRSMADLVFHLFATDRGWRVGLQAGHQPAFPDPADYPDASALQAAFAAEETAWNDYLEGLQEADIAGTMTLTALNGMAWPMPRWRVLQHVLLHGMQHHSELAQLLTEQDASPGDIDFIFFQGD